MAGQYLMRKFQEAEQSCGAPSERAVERPDVSSIGVRLPLSGQVEGTPSNRCTARTCTKERRQC